MLQDQHQRTHNYLRVSVTDSCNFRCAYCMPNEEISCMPNSHLMQVNEIEEIAKIFVDFGVNKIRLTGGEPLVRKEIDEIITRLSKLPVELTMTSNGVYIPTHLNVIKNANIQSINISLDTLKEDKFFVLAKRKMFDKVWQSILLLLENNITVKVNVVAMKNVNDDEIIDFISLTKNLPLHIRFIEFMPFSGNEWEKQKVITAAEMLEQVANHFDFEKLPEEKNATAKNFAVKGYQGTFGFITTMSSPFCGDCNRMRITADGKMKNCLFSKGETDLLTAFRNGEDIKPLIQQNIWGKFAKMGGQFQDKFTETNANEIHNRSMIKIGG